MASKLPDDVSAPYHKLSQKTFSQRSAQDHARHLIPHIKPHHRILDIGCGPGSITGDLAQLVPEGEVIGIDSNPESIETAKALAESRGLKNVTFRVGDVKKDLSDIESESFDIVHTHQVLLHLAEPLETMREMRRLLKPGGILSTVDSAFRVLVPSIPGVISSNEAYESFSRGRGADPNFGQRHHIVAHGAGFAWQDMEISTRGMQEMSDEAKKRLGENSGPTADKFVEAGVVSSEEAEEQKKGWREWGNMPESRYLELASALICWKR